MHKEKSFWALVSCVLLSSSLLAQPAQNPQTFCNPLNLNYMFMDEAVDAREAADPVIVLFKDDYYLFASHSGGYWTSPDLRNWTLIIPTGLNISNYAPAVVAMRDSLFLITSEGVQQVYKTGDPKSGKWTSQPIAKGYQDPALFLDDDGRLYMYHGLSQDNPIIYGVELDPMTFQEIGSQVVLFAGSGLYAIHGWERRGDGLVFESDMRPWIEGSWMNKENGKYYLKYAAPGTEWKTYSDGVYVADSPLGPFQYAPYSPVDFKPTGFVSGGGHGATFKDKDGNYWHVGTMTISVKNIFERRLALYPVGFDADGNIHTNTAFGDYPQYFPGVKTSPVDENFAGMMLLSHKKFVQASSSLHGHGAEKAVDEDIRTYWSALSGDAGEWLMVDLGKECSVEAIQVNFAEQNTDPKIVRGRNNNLYQQYIIEKSLDGITWDVLVDKSQNMQDVPHDYIELAQATQARYIKLTNVFLAPGMGFFAIQDLRVFGNSKQAVFTKADFTVQRDAADGRDAVIRWSPVAGADGYIIRYGIAPNKLYNNYIVYDVDSVFIRSLNHGVDYYFDVEAFDSGTDYYQPVGEFHSFQTGNWNDVATWAQYDGATWVHPAPNVPTISDGPITILDGQTVTITAADSADQLTVASGATLVINEGVTFKIKNGIGTDLMVEGTVRNKGSITSEALATLSFANNGLYEHAQEGGTIPTATWRPGSTCLINSVKGSAPSNGNQSFYNVVWNCPNQTGNLNMGWNGNTIGGNITILNTGTGRWQMCAPLAGDSATVTIIGDIIQSGGQFTSSGTSNANTTITINQHGDINVTGGDFSVSRGSQGGTGTTVWNLIGGNVSLVNATTQNSNSTGAKFVFMGDGGVQTLTFSGVTFGAGGFPVEVDSGATLDLGTSILRGGGAFTLKPGAILQTAHPAGLDSSISNTGTKTFAPDAGYAFNGSTAQVTGNLMPGTVGSLIISNTAGVTLSKSVLVNGTLEMKSGTLSLGSHALTYGANSSLKYSGTTAQTTTDAEFPSSGGPKNLVIANPRGVTLHASRAISENLTLSGRLTVGSNTLTASSTSNGSSTTFVVTTGGGALKLTSVGGTQTLFPVGTTSYAPVWITNSGAVDTISVGVIADATAAAYGGRIRVKWNINESVAGGGNYTLQFGWVSALEDVAFRTDRAGNARIFHMVDTTEAGSGNYTTQFVTQPYTVSRGGITTLGPFAVGRFREVTGVTEGAAGVPMKFSLSQNYPNPFNPTTIIQYSVSNTQHVSLNIYDLLGREVETLVNEVMQPGTYTVQWNAVNNASGVYLYRLVTDDFVQVKRMVLIR